MQNGVTKVFSIMICLLITVSFTIIAIAEDEIRVIIDGNEAVFVDAKPFINEDGRTMVPIRFISEQLGALVSWEKEGANVVTIEKDKKINITIGKNEATIDGKIITLDTSPVIYMERTFVPLRFVSEILGLQVSWDEEKNSAVLSTKKTEKDETMGEPQKRVLNNNTDEGIEEVNVLDFGADPKGIKDSTSDIKQAHNTGKRVYYPNGIYKFNGKDLNFSGGVRFESMDGVLIRNNISESSIINFDDFGNLIGLQHNHLESFTVNQSDVMNVGNIIAPPLSQSEYKTKVDFLAHWYNDGGLETRRTGVGWNGWYYWNWNYHSAGAGSDDPAKIYDPERHPLLGFYRGDDVNVLDWQCYWLAEYGVTGVIFTTSPIENGIAKTWSNPSSPNYWVYQLFANTPNFKKIKYVMTLSAKYINRNSSTDETRQRVRDEWFNTIEDVYFDYDNFYCMERDGLKYPAIYVHEELAIPGAFDNYSGAANTVEFYKEVANKFKEKGYAGVALLTRHPDSFVEAAREELQQAGVLRYDTLYALGYYENDATTYAEIVESYSPPVNEWALVNTYTGAYTHAPHPSGWNRPGQTPELFQEMIEKAVKHVYENNMPRVLTCYNVAEWAEGGPGLQPNMKNRFGYLNAVKNAIVEK